MSVDIALKCKCGKLAGMARKVTPAGGNRIICMCDDCQAFAKFLGCSEVLDAHGGTDIFQLRPSQLTFTQGKQQLRCIKLKEKGMLRWYADCCKTPVANMMASAKVPFVGMPWVIMDHAQSGMSRDQALGPV